MRIPTNLTFYAAFCHNHLIYFILYCKREFFIVITWIICLSLFYMPLLAVEYMLCVKKSLNKIGGKDENKIKE